MNKWDIRFLELAQHISKWSKDKSTKVGCVIVGPDREILTTGYNGLPRGADDNVKDRDTRPEKYFWFEHAERNAIYNAVRSGVKLNESTAYSTLCPCMDCARAFVQSGITRVVLGKKPTHPMLTHIKLNNIELWGEHFQRTEALFKECNVELVFV